MLGLDETTVGGALQRLETAGLLFSTGTSKTTVSYAFKHALIRDVAYNNLLKSKRRHYHARIAECLASQDADAAHSPEVLAYHHMEAGQFEPAASYWCAAAERAGARYANSEAIAHCRKGLLALSQLPRGAKRADMELGVRIALAEGLRITDHYSEALAELSIAEALATESNRLLELARIHHLRGNIYYPLGKAENCFIGHKAA